MKVIHIAPNAVYTDYWGYQENMIPHYNKLDGHDVTVITKNLKFENNRIVETDCGEYVLNDGVRIIRLRERKYFSRLLTNLAMKLEIYSLLREISPDFIFFHGVTSSTIFDCIKYKKKDNSNCAIVCDNHLDYYNGSSSFGLRNKIKRAYYRIKIKLFQKYISKFYGVTPWRVQYLTDYFKVPKEKTQLLVMGGDDEHIHFERLPQIRNDIRNQLNIAEDEFMILTGGKIDITKNIHLLMEAVSEIDSDNIKLVVFGKINDEIEEKIHHLADNKNIRYIGWLESNKVYDYFLAADLIVFPGTHSVLWEQACACGVPCVFKDWNDGMKHVDVGGNCLFLYEDDKDEIKTLITDIVNNKEKYEKMKKVAVEKGIKYFSYNEISRRAIEL